jgi:hypothetical protein
LSGLGIEIAYMPADGEANNYYLTEKRAKWRGSIIAFAIERFSKLIACTGIKAYHT